MSRTSRSLATLTVCLFVSTSFAQTERVNLASPGDVQATMTTCSVVFACRYGKDISSDGRYVCFETFEALDAADTSLTQDVYVRDRQSQETRRVSFQPSGAQGLFATSGASMSRDGRFVTYGRFVTTPPPIQEIFVHDRDADGNGVFDEAGGTSTSIVVRGSLGQAANMSLSRPVISDDGRYVAFETRADNLDPLIVDDNDAIDIYWTDRDTDGNGVFDEPGTSSTRIMSYDPVAGVVAGDEDATQLAISGDGLHVAYRTFRALDATIAGAPLIAQMYVHDVAAGATRPMSVNLGGGYGVGVNNLPAFSASGRYLVFESQAPNMVPESTFAKQVYLRDRDTDADGVFDEAGAVLTELVSRDVNCIESTTGNHTDASVSDDGRFVAFATTSGIEDLTGIPDVAVFADVLVYDRALCQTILISSEQGGSGAGNQHSRACEISGDGAHVAFSSAATDLVAGDTNAVTDLFVRSLSPASPFTNYCMSTPTSTGNASTIQASGSASVLANDLVLSADSVPVGEPGLFYYGPAQLAAPFGNGTRCVGGPGGTVVRIFPFAQASGAGVLVTALDNTLSVHVQVVPGASLNFQAWFRDPAAGGSGFDLSDGLNVLFGL